MATMIGEVYDALRAAGAPEPEARKAAEAMAAYDPRFGGIESRMSSLEGDMKLLKWMVGFNIAVTVMVLGRLLFTN